MPQMSKPEVQYYLDRMIHFRNPHQMAKMFNVTYATALRWVRYETLPSDKYRPIFEEAFDQLIDDLADQNEIGHKLTITLTDEPAPRPRNAVVQRPSRANLRDIIISFLHNGKKIRSTKIFAETAKMGYSRISVQTAARKMGVIKEEHGSGRNSYSLWRLP